MNIVSLEYSPKQRVFHFNEQQHTPHAWRKIADMSIQDAMFFVDFMEKKYVNGRATGTLPEIRVVCIECDLFTELKAVRRKLAGRG